MDINFHETGVSEIFAALNFVDEWIPPKYTHGNG